MPEAARRQVRDGGRLVEAHCRAGPLQDLLQDIGDAQVDRRPGKRRIGKMLTRLATECARLHRDRLLGLVLVDPATLGQRHEFKQANPGRVLADDKALLSMPPPAMAVDYKLLVEQLDSEAAAAPQQQPDLPVALPTSTNVSPEPFVLEETGQGKTIWKRQHAALFAGFSRGTHQYFGTGHTIHRENPKAVADAMRAFAASAAGEGG